MVPEHDDYDEKPSWRDIDRQRDKSSHTGRDTDAQRPKSPKKEWAQKMYLKEIENLFKGKKATPEHAVALNEIHLRAGTKKFNTAVKKYVKEYGLPDDWSTLFLLLDYKDVKIVRQSVEKLVRIMDEEPLNKKEGLKSKLSIMAMTAEDDDVREIAQEHLEGL
ncbi:MAG: hypothetical protein FJ119_00575 [Deltaproteobacteria bacterium]|nr:hypothetical protein [Deltaproteobacteria bacterium]